MAARRLVRALRSTLPQARASARLCNAEFTRPPESSPTLLRSTFYASPFKCSPQLHIPIQIGSGARCFASGELPPHIVLGMPALSPTMTQGNVVEWKKKEGEQVSPGDVLCVIETDKATVDFESVEEGFLARILVSAGSNNVPVGQTIGVMVEDASDISKLGSASFDSAKKEAQPASKPPPSSSAQASTKPSPAKNLPPHIVLGMPALSPTMTQGNIVEWRKKEGEQISPGDVLCIIETDKATVDFESVEEGYLAKIVAPSGSKNVAIGQVVGVMVEDAGDISKVAAGDFVGQPSAGKADEAPTVQKTSSASRVSGAPSSKPLSRVGPSVRRLLAESGLDASSIHGSGPRGVLLKGDVLAAIKSGRAGGASKAEKPRRDASPGPSPSTSLSFEDKPNSQIRKIIAKRLLESKHGIPHFYVSSDAVLDSTLLLRKEMKEKHGASVSVNDFVIRATALALKSVPEANAFWDEKTGEIVLHNSIDISIAVATDKGLLTPIVKSADQKSLSAISSEVKSLAEKARNGKLKPEEFQGGSFSISNLGMFPVDRFSAIINPPQACILAVGKGEKVVVWDESGEKPRTQTKLVLTLSVDNRVFDTTIAGRLLDALTANLHDPQRMLL